MSAPERERLALAIEAFASALADESGASVVRQRVRLAALVAALRDWDASVEVVPDDVSRAARECQKPFALSGGAREPSARRAWPAAVAAVVGGRGVVDHGEIGRLHDALQSALSRGVARLGARLAFVIDANGTLLASVGDSRGLDGTSFGEAVSRPALVEDIDRDRRAVVDIDDLGRMHVHALEHLVVVTTYPAGKGPDRTDERAFLEELSGVTRGVEHLPALDDEALRALIAD